MNKEIILNFLEELNTHLKNQTPVTDEEINQFLLIISYQLNKDTSDPTVQAYLVYLLSHISERQSFVIKKAEKISKQDKVNEIFDVLLNSRNRDFNKNKEIFFRQEIKNG